MGKGKIMAKKPAAKASAKMPEKGASGSSAPRPTVTVADGDIRSYDDLMKLPKAQIVRTMSAPENKARYIVDVDKQTSLGKKIIALMDSLRSEDMVAIRAVSEILGALGNMVAKKTASKK
jgi:hypothetical protein